MADLSKLYFISFGFALLGLTAVLMLGLLPALLAGLLVYQLVDFGAESLARYGIRRNIGRMFLLFLVSVVVVFSISLLVIMLASYVTDGPESLVVLLQKMADVVDTGKNYLPLWVQEYVPSNMNEVQTAYSEWLRKNAGNLSAIGGDIGIFLIHIIIGMIIGGMIALHHDIRGERGIFAQALGERIEQISQAFRRIVFSQVRISALNTVLTGIFLVLVMPLLGHPLPLTKVMIAVTFVAGLLPVIGNLISNSVIFLIALSVSPIAAVVSLTYLIVIHKLEYFVNARIIGSQIEARAWELLIAMLVMESAFGLAGVVAAPIYYAYIKGELSSRRLI